MPQSASILIIDDEEAICFAFKRYFEDRGHRVRVAASGRGGLEHYAADRADVVFLDVRLPDGDGLAVLERRRQADEQACVIVMTAYGSMETVTRAIRGKAFDDLAAASISSARPTRKPRARSAPAKRASCATMPCAALMLSILRGGVRQQLGEPFVSSSTCPFCR